MAELILFHYSTAPSRLGKYDSRHKLPILILLAVTLFHVDPAGLVVVTLVIAVGVALSRLPVARAGRELVPFLVILALGFCAEALTLPGTPLSWFRPASVEGTRAGALLVWRLLDAYLLGAVFVASTPLSFVRAAIVWYLSPFRFIPAGRIATMVGLTVSLIPLLFDTYRGIAEAQASRGAAGGRRPLHRVSLLAVALLIRTFSNADALVSAMEARCYTDDRTVARLRSGAGDWAASGALVASAAVCLVFLRA